MADTPQSGGQPDDNFLRCGLLRSCAGQLLAQMARALSRTGLDTVRSGALTY